MKIEELNRMTPDQKRVKIAEACGWSVKHVDGVPKNVCQYELIRPDGTRKGYAFKESTLWKNYAPDYLNDLNAMHEAAMTLTGFKADLFANILVEIIGARKIETYSEKIGAPQLSWGGVCQIARATASQLADAFLLTI